jgi:hypothetical protein
MPNLSVGQEVWIPCKVQPGPFSDELLVTVESGEGTISGFVNAQELREGPRGGSQVRGIVRSVQERSVEVWIRGSFFTTNGLTNVPREMATAA